MSTDSISTRYARALLNLVAEKGDSRERALAAAGIDFDPARPDADSYRPEISALQYSRLYRRVLGILHDESVGVSSARAVSPGAFRMMCYAIIHSGNLGRALYRASEFFQIFFDHEAMLTLHQEDGVAAMGYIREIAGDADVVDDLEAHGLAMWHRFCGWLTGRVIELTEVGFQGGAPTPSARYRRLFGCPVHYGRAATELVFDAECLQWPLVHTEHSLNAFLRTAPYRLMMMPARAADSSLIGRVRAMLGHDFSRGFPSFVDIATALNMSAPTLRRRLKGEGKTFQQLKDECRCDAAIAHLRRPELSINAVATLMGFTDPSAFHRSFKKWTGMPPGEYRARKLGRRA